MHVLPEETFLHDFFSNSEADASELKTHEEMLQYMLSVYLTLIDWLIDCLAIFIIIINIYIALFFEVTQSAAFYIDTYELRTWVYDVCMYDHKRLMNKTPPQSTIPTESEHVVGPRNTPLLTYLNCGLNANQFANHWGLLQPHTGVLPVVKGSTMNLI